MNTFEAVETLENGTDNEIEYYASIQHMINAGQWSFQGSFGRAMMDAIESGKVMLGVDPARAAYGNFIPSRTMVKAGTKGSRLFVTRQSGKLHSKLMAEVI